MKKIIFLLFSVCALLANAQTYIPTPANLAARKQFQDMKFGMFIHWGASSVLGSGEWVMNNRNIRVKEYQNLQRVFNPIDFDAKAWVDAAQGAGMNYITIITRPHESFIVSQVSNGKAEISAPPKPVVLFPGKSFSNI